MTTMVSLRYWVRSRESDEAKGFKVLLTIDELAAYLKISRETIYKMAQKGSIPAVKVGVQWRFDQADIDNWIQNNRNSKSRELNSTRNKSSIRNIEE